MNKWCQLCKFYDSCDNYLKVCLVVYVRDKLPCFVSKEVLK